ncbi:NIPSNAP family protein [Hymenobacter crusticola]|uniref:NIPSNAP family containing protein n=1 Tax=Hymenobacter crusticola TaxID=1770526 RepID=A0A243WEU2_9BACT|nr:NIPSNAP family protein [Hymenobacter crusticola]OUJ74215.1 NIPSNAP family containing protein [Hymenobacter crusticola]
MKSLKFTLLLFSLILFGLGSPLRSSGAAPKREFYQLKIYHLQTKEQEQRLDTYLQQAYLPALHRAGIGKVGVFKPIASTDASAPAPTEQLVFVFIPCTSAEQYLKIDTDLEKDKQYQTAAQDYVNTAFDKPVYSRMEGVSMLAFTSMPSLHLPALKSGPAERVYELRSYESASEKLHANKVAQFNNGEIGIFKRLNFNTVFCGQVVSGSKMPNLMYLSAFENKADQEAHWKTFGADPEWAKMKAMPEYANNMQHMDVFLLHPATYSDI